MGFVAALILTVGLPQFARCEQVDRIVAIVNDDIILQSEMEQAMSPIREQLRQSGYSMVQQDLALADQHNHILEQMITETLTDQQVKKFHIAISEQEINRTIERIIEMNDLTRDQFEHKLEMDGMDYDEFKSEIKEKLLRSKLVNLQVNSKIVITDEDARAYYEKNSEQYGGQTKYHLRRILIRSGSGPSDGKDGRERIERIYERLKSGESFAQLATVYSEDKFAADGGDLGAFEVRLLAADIQKALDGLQKGQYSTIFETEQGYQVLYIEDIIQAGGKSFDDVKTEIQDKLYAEIVDQKFQGWLKDLRDQAHIQIIP
jgi:peptidyl-prolyl cis-trans isomerase SurA